MAINWYWVGGGAAVTVLGGLVYARSRKSSDTSEADAPAPVTQPLFMASGGGTSQPGTGDLPLGGKAWEPPVVPLSENPDVKIAQIAADVQTAAIGAAKELQIAGVNAAASTYNKPAPSVPPPVNTTAAPPAVNASASQWRGHSITEGANYIKNIVLPKSATVGAEATEMAIYKAAKNAGYSVYETALSMSDAIGRVVTPAEVQAWLAQRGLSL